MVARSLKTKSQHDAGLFRPSLLLKHGSHLLDKDPFLFPCWENKCSAMRKGMTALGYPHALKGDAIPLAARLFAVIDTLDAMTFDRPYRKGLPFDTAKAEIVRMSGSQFDPATVETFPERGATAQGEIDCSRPPRRGTGRLSHHAFVNADPQQQECTPSCPNIQSRVHSLMPSRGGTGRQVSALLIDRREQNGWF